MADYAKIIPMTLLYEGGSKFTNIPEDRGGATKWGVSELFVNGTGDMMFDLNGDGKLSEADIRLMTEEVATEGFKKYFWDKYNLDFIPSDRCAFVIFDTAMNNGPGNMARIAQRTCNRILGANLKVDGAYGPATANAVYDAVQEDPEGFFDVFLTEREKFYHKIVEARPNQVKFIKGWLNRIKNIRRDAETLDN